MQVGGGFPRLHIRTYNFPQQLEGFIYSSLFMQKVTEVKGCSSCIGNPATQPRELQAAFLVPLAASSDTE